MCFMRRALLQYKEFDSFNYVLEVLDEYMKHLHYPQYLAQFEFWKAFIKVLASMLSEGTTKGTLSETKSEMTELIKSADPEDEEWCQKLAGRQGGQEVIEKSVLCRSFYKK